MPNWTTNKLEITHEDANKITEFQEAFQTGLFQHYLPADENSCESHIEKWGTKWDVEADSENTCEVLGDNKLFLEFLTAWNPPIAFYEHLETLGFEVQAAFCEQSMDMVGMFYDGKYFEGNWSAFCAESSEEDIQKLHLTQEVEDEKRMQAEFAAMENEEINRGGLDYAIQQAAENANGYSFELLLERGEEMIETAISQEQYEEVSGIKEDMAKIKSAMAEHAWNQALAS